MNRAPEGRIVRRRLTLRTFGVIMAGVYSNVHWTGTQKTQAPRKQQESGKQQEYR